MISGKTGETVTISGVYNCGDHPEIQNKLIENDHFPHCSLNNNHEATWILKENNGIGNVETSLDTSGIKKENEKEKKAEEPGDYQYIFKNVNPDLVYKRKGFFFAINNVKFQDLPEYKLDSLIQTETGYVQNLVAEIRLRHKEKIDVVKQKFDNLKNLLAEKIEIRKEFETELDAMQLEYDSLTKEINGYYIQLRDQVKALGTSKEDLISKRIQEFENEINKVIDIYQNVESKQNEKFRSDFQAKALRDSEKKFYYDYRGKLEQSFSNVQNRVRALEKEGLNITVAKFLIAIGWISSLVSSWFFELSYGNSNTQSSSGLLVYIFDNLRNFVLQQPVWITILVFMGYVIVVMLISKYCYTLSLEYKFIGESNYNQKKNQPKDEDQIEFSLDREGLLKTQFKASSWFEMWLKMAPFISMILLLIIILAIGSSKNNTYENLSQSLYVQLIGLLLPLSFTGLIFLYITKIVEARMPLHSADNEENSRASSTWGLLISAILFLALISLLIIYQFKLSALTEIRVPVWGFFTGCLCTGLALAYGYRFITVNESFDLLVERIHLVNHYIDKVFYPFEASYLKHGSILYRMRTLYHSLLNFIESRNNLATRLLNPHLGAAKKDNSEIRTNRNVVFMSSLDEMTDDGQVNNISQKGGKESGFRFFFNYLFNSFQAQIRKWKQKLNERDLKIRELQNKITELENDSIDIDAVTYFPEVAAKIKEIKSLIEERSKRLIELKEELEGYFRNEKTYASLNQQIQNILDQQKQLATDIESMEIKALNDQEKINEELKIKINLLQEGYNIGIWYSKSYPTLT